MKSDKYDRIPCNSSNPLQRGSMKLYRMSIGQTANSNTQVPLRQLLTYLHQYVMQFPQKLIRHILSLWHYVRQALISQLFRGGNQRIPFQFR